MLQSKIVNIILFSCLTLMCCKEDKSQKKTLVSSNNQYKNIYAEGFKIEKHLDAKILEISNAWPQAEKTYKYLVLDNEQADKSMFNKEAYDGVIITPIDKIVVTSTTHLPALELLNVHESLVGFPGNDYVSSEKIRNQIDIGKVRELGGNESLNTEVLLEIKPNLVVGYSVDGNNKALETIRNSGIPVIYNGDWVEKSPLAKAEWIKFFGVLFGKEKEANSIFNKIESDYLEAKTLASKAETQPTVLCGAMHKDIWYLPNGTSPEAQILNDASVNYLWKDTKDKGSIALSFESVFEKAKHAELWLSPSYYNSFDTLEKASQHYTTFDAFKNKNIYSFASTTGKTGGVLYYELGTARPDLVLKDIIKIAHPELLKDYQTFFFKPIQ